MLRPVLILCLLLAWLPFGQPQAATFTVNLFTDDLIDATTGDCICSVGIGGCTLRAAIMEANACPGSHTIHFAPSALNQVVVLDLAGAGGAESGDLDITKNLNIRGWQSGTSLPPTNADSLPVIDASALGSNIFDIAAGVQVDIRGLQLRGGQSNDAGAIRNRGTLTLAHMRFEGNAGDLGGAISSAAGSTLTVNTSDFVLNTASSNSGAGGAIRNLGHATIRRSSFRDNRHSGSAKATIYTGPGSTLFVEDSTLSGEQLAPGDNINDGIRAANPALLRVRNVSIIDLRLNRIALRLAQLDGTGVIRVANSVLSNDDGTGACSLTTVAGNAGDVLLDHSFVRMGASAQCLPYFGADVFDGPEPQLGPWQQNPHELTRYRLPVLLSNLRDAGNPNALDPDAAMRCTGLAQNGISRPQDGDGDGIARCDIGATEAANAVPVTFIVDSGGDAPDANPGNGICATAGGACTLRAAVMEANAKPGADRIEFAEDIDTVTLTLGGPGGAEAGDLDITEQVTIVGNQLHGRPQTTVQGGPAYLGRLFRVALPPGESVRFEGLVLERGRAPNFQDGGALLLATDNQVTLEGVVLRDNEANGANGRGGALAASAGELVLRDVDIHDNSASGEGWGIHIGAAAGLVMEDSSLRRHSSDDILDPKSALYLDGASAHLRNVTLSGHQNAIYAVGDFDLQLHNSSFHSDPDILGMHQHLRVMGGINSSLQVVGSAFDNIAGSCSITMAIGSNLDINHYNLSDGSCALAFGAGTNFIQAALFYGRTAPVEGRVARVAMPRPGSPLLDRVPIDAFHCPGQDQRGVPRPINATGQVQALCDIGAVELSPFEAQPQPWVVNVFDVDLPDGNACDGRCDADESQTGLQCSLRAAVMEAACNTQPHPAEIVIPQAGVTLPLTLPSQVDLPDGPRGPMMLTGSYELSVLGPAVEGDQRPLILADHDANIFSGIASLRLENLRLAGGRAITSEYGGAIRLTTGPLTLRNVEVFDNQAIYGGAIWTSGANVELDRVSMHGNVATTFGSAILRANNGVLRIYESSIVDNTVLDPGYRAAVHTHHQVGASVLVRNTTISANNGVGVLIDLANGTASAELAFHSVTIAGNAGRGIFLSNAALIDPSSWLRIRQSVLTGNIQGSCSAQGGNWNGVWDTVGFNLSQDAGCGMSGGSNLIGVSALLGPLQWPPGATPFHAPLPGSPLIDGGAPDGSDCPQTDQLGNPRPQDGNGDGIARCNIGAIESDTVPVVIPPAGETIFSSGFES
jgi:CSLREA domain-containing protein